VIDEQLQRLCDELRSLGGVMLFDGGGKFCRRAVKRLLAGGGGASLRRCSVRSNRGRALATALGRRPEDTFAFITGSRTYLDLLAYEAILSLTQHTRSRAWLIARSPGAISGGLYRWVASHRPRPARPLRSTGERSSPAVMVTPASRLEAMPCCLSGTAS
jgi:predicted DCC family thiol-disulfide oxidoreductase YuxK